MTINAKLARNLGIFFDPSFGAVGGTEGTALAGEEAIFSMKIRDASGKQIMWLHDLTNRAQCREVGPISLTSASIYKRGED